MIEIIYKEEQKKADGNEQFFRIPNNIRQIGEIRGQQKIYIEDYAYTFLKKISRIPEEGGKAAILLGQYHWSEGIAYLFIKSALQVKDMEVSPEHIVFSDKVWGQVYEDSRKYFPQQEIVGWFVSLPGFNMQINEVLLKTHLNHFAGNDKVLFVVEPGEWEEAFFAYENNQLNRQPGYYIYYEKNEPMQAYMIDMSENKSIEETEKIPDRAVIDFRRTVKRREERKENGKENVTDEQKKDGDEKKTGHMSWTLCACTAAAALALGITFFNSYKNMSGTLEKLIPGLSVQQEETVEEVNAGTVLSPTTTADSQSVAGSNMQPENTLPGEEIGGDLAESAGTTGILGNEPETGESGENQADDTVPDLGQENNRQTDTDGKSDGNRSNSGQGTGEDRKNGQSTEGQTENGQSTEGQEETGQGTEEQTGVGQDTEQRTAQAQRGQENTAETDSRNTVQQASQNLNGNSREYTIQKGDTLTSISKTYYGTIAKVEEICRLNGISPDDIIYAGQKIVLPE